MKKLNLNQRNVLADFYSNLAVATLSIIVISNLFINKNINYYSLILGIISIIISITLLYGSLKFFSK